MDMGYDDSNNVCYQRFRNLGIFKYLLYTVHKIDFEGRFLDKIHKAGPVWAAAVLTSFSVPMHWCLAYCLPLVHAW